MFKYSFFQMRYDAKGRRGFTGLEKCVATIKLMDVGELSDSIDDYTRIYERIAREYLFRLTRGVLETFCDVYFGNLR